MGVGSDRSSIAMKSNRVLPFLACALLALPCFGATGQAEQMIEKARAFLGGDAALDAVKSLQFSGSIIEGTEKRGTIVITLQKSFQQRIERTVGDEREITALDGYDAWSRRENLKDPSDWRLQMIEADDIRRLQANNAENLNFFRGAERYGGSVEYTGSKAVDGIDCARLVFKHTPEIEFVRYFDKATGRLVMTETERGGEIREHGEQFVDGIRFPTSLESTLDGKTVTITFEKVVVNAAYPESMFEFPSVMPTP